MSWQLLTRIYLNNSHTYSRISFIVFRLSCSLLQFLNPSIDHSGIFPWNRNVEYYFPVCHATLICLLSSQYTVNVVNMAHVRLTYFKVCASITNNLDQFISRHFHHIAYFLTLFICLYVKLSNKINPSGVNF